MNKGRCPNPNCAAIVSDAEIEAVILRQNGVPKWNGISYHCPKCRTVLGVQIDPVALKSDLADEILGRA
jgi:hypothetical protein